MISGVSQYSSYLSGIDLTALKTRREEMFSKMDTDSNGYVDKVELQSFGEQLAAEAKGPTADELLSQMDTDGDGQISKAEFDAAEAEREGRMASMKPGPPPMSTEETFSIMDTNGDGTVDKTELEAFLQQSAVETGQTENSSDIFSALDTDGDGKISQAEFNAAQVKMETAMTAAMAGQARFDEGSSSNTIAALSESSETSADGEASTIGSAMGKYVYAYQPAVQPVLDLIG
ncbi:MAG: XopAW family type III secretion system calcium-binding effector [candidate division Zixibacteria bacterium]|nr:XopAW family type III secretion system calcium-binding effector [candidate division Zixibacteria bacterium]